MPTYEWLSAFGLDLKKLTPAQRAAFETAIVLFVADLKAGNGFRASLRVKKMQGHDGIWEMSFGADSRATFEYGPEQVPGEVHVKWRRVGTHDVFKRP
ncbi:hypothetical protein [Streptomyces sp. NBC_01264]|uniref:hypothetical protein n=1 Tax=Streptomyces sp. NBC_01264 TaxID=2903804 RepID=UPI002259B0C9|nr:hypothetical protein [Streptomyces sp. NBC_01264]MCX4783329.1 hypothetical protein [Streptomyces sp. NBC_01264]